VTSEPPTGWGASAHPGFERLAELDEGLLDPDETTQTQAHLAGCAQCRDQQAQLQRATTLLAQLPPEPMPAAVAARLDAALSAAAAPGSTTIVPLDARRSRWLSKPMAAGLGVAAAAVAVVVALTVGGGSGSKHPATGPVAGASASQAESALQNLTTSVSGTNYTNGNLAATVPGLVEGPVGTSGAAGGAAPAPTAPKANSGPHNKAGANAPMSSAIAVGPPAALRPLYSSPSALRDCVRGVEAGGATQRPLAIDFATYLGKPAVLIVLPGLSAGNLDAWFVGPACNATDVHLLGYKAVPASS